jgi:hypothetical protein
VLGALALLWLPGASGLREDEFHCELAVAHLEECCPDFDPGQISCNYASGCDSTTHTALDLGESQCIEDRDCGTIIDRRICERALAQTPGVERTDTTSAASSGTSTGQERACP